MTSGSNWFQDPGLLTAEIKRARAPSAEAPAIPGYDDLREVARGGQGIVYRGIQRSTRRHVAVKVLLDGALASGAARRRFEREIDLVAGLKHPSIVSVYDSGATGDGRLYLVMEYIQGAPLDDAVRHSAGGPLDVKKTIGLFAQVCEALRFAHQRGVIHRDLKPSNIRVDQAGTPHILDFGLAKVAGADAARSVLSTSGHFVGSLPWASPEQASGETDRADTRSDVYSLGVILYQVLTGRFPYDVGSGLRATLDNIIGASPEPATRFRAEIDDEVWTIIARCLQKEPERRYQSAGDLARDLRHYLAGEPIEAKRDSAWYTLRKQLQRYRLAAGAAAAFVLVIVAALIVSILLFRDATRQRDKAASEAARARATNEFLLEMLRAADPDKEGPKTPIVDLLDGAAAVADSRFAGKDDVREAVHTTLRDTYMRLGEFAKAEPHARTVVALRRRYKGEEAPETLSAVADLCTVISKQQRAGEVEEELGRVLAIQRRTLGAYDERTLSTVTALAQGMLYRDRAADAASLYESVREGMLAALGPDNETSVTVISNLATAYDELGRFKEAEALYRDSLERRLRISGPQHTEMLTVMNNLGTLFIRQNRFTDAEPLLKEQLDQMQRRLGPDNASTLTALSNYAKLLQDMGRLTEAEPLMKQAMEGRIKVLGEDHPHTMISMNNVATLYAMTKRFDDSEKMHRRVLALRTARLGPEALDTIISTNNLGGTLRELGRYEEALPLFQRAVEVTDRTLPPGHFFNALFRMNMGWVLFKMGRADEAEAPLLAAFDALQKAVGPAHSQTRKCADNLAVLYEAQGEPEKSQQYRALAAPPPPPAPAK